MNFVKYFKFFNILSFLLFLLAIFSLFFFGLKFSIDFTGGSILEVDFEGRPENPIIQEKLKDFNLGEIIVQPIGEKGVILRMPVIDEETHQKIVSKLNEISKIEEKRFESIGPTVGKELREKTVTLITVSLVFLLIFISIAFSKISRPISSWQYGLISIVTLSFDVAIAIGIFSLLGKLYNAQFNIPIVTALLTILGYTINDKVIVFDRIRENILRGERGKTFEETVNMSLNQTLTRSLSTGTCTLLVLFSLFFFGGETLKYFALILIVGIIIGTYSSLFLATPLLVIWLKSKKRGQG
jgi:preprotein translocase subunit SecF